MNGKEEVLARIRSALEGAAPAEPPGPATYRVRGERERAAVVEEFLERVRDYGVDARMVQAAGLPRAIGEACRARGARILAVPRDLPADWLVEGFEWTPDDALSTVVLDRADGVVSGCLLAIAQTGTIVLDGGPRQGRRMLSLLPDYHLCVVEVGQLVDLVPEAIAELARRDPAERAITFISGPSATSDIELSRVEGVHGPRTLEVLLVEP